VCDVENEKAIYFLLTLFFMARTTGRALKNGAMCVVEHHHIVLAVNGLDYRRMVWQTAAELKSTYHKFVIRLWVWMVWTMTWSRHTFKKYQTSLW
jgi:hypothetical protein